MENKNTKNVIPIDIDTINLKDHLKTSFENDNIKVSEELIARTLQAIKMDNLVQDNQIHDNQIHDKQIHDNQIHDKQLHDNQLHNKQIHDILLHDNKHKNKRTFPIRRLVSAAAVILVLFVGIKALQDNTLLNGFSFGNSKSESNANAEYGILSDSGTTFDTKLSQEDGADTEIKIEETSKAFSADIAMSENSTENPENEDANVTQSKSLFTELYTFTTDQVESFTVTNDKQQIITTTRTAEKAREFYALLDEYTLTAELNDIRDMSESWSYKIEIKTEKNDLYTILVGEGIQFEFTEEPSSANEYYTIENENTLIKRMDDFYNSLE